MNESPIWPRTGMTTPRPGESTIEVKVSPRIKINRRGYDRHGQYFGINQTPLYWVEMFYPNGRYVRAVSESHSYQALRCYFKTYRNCKVLP